MPTHKKHTLASHSMQRCNQSLQERVFSPTQEEFQNIFPALQKKLKHAPHKPTQTNKQTDNDTQT